MYQIMLIVVVASPALHFVLTAHKLMEALLLSWRSFTRAPRSLPEFADCCIIAQPFQDESCKAATSPSTHPSSSKIVEKNMMLASHIKLIRSNHNASSETALKLTILCKTYRKTFDTTHLTWRWPPLLLTAAEKTWCDNNPPLLANWTSKQTRTWTSKNADLWRGWIVGNSWIK